MSVRRIGAFLWRSFRLSVVILASLAVLARSDLPPATQLEQIRAYTRDLEFDYVSWAAAALFDKVNELALGTVNYFPEEEHANFILEYLALVSQIQRQEGQLSRIYTDPAVADPEAASAEVRQELHSLYRRREQLAPLAEGIMQRQVAAAAAEMGLTLGGQPVPPVLYKVTPLPMALVVSPREVIRQEYNISLNPGMSVDEQAALERAVDGTVNVSSLVVSIGGVGLYPTMVMETSSVVWLAEIVAHEWIHNYLTLRPLGASYLPSRELHVMNETAAAIAGKEIGLRVIERYYPEHLPPPPPPSPSPPAEPPETSPPPEPPAFDFRAEMRETRVRVDALLAEGKIDEAEEYMEVRRRFLWDNGYQIRKLNQAYFAFFGAYADQPGGAAGEDPVGEAVRRLRQQSGSLAEFINRISWFWSFEQLEREVARIELFRGEAPP
jgi:hypothetical protein